MFSGSIWNTQPSRNLLLVHEANTAGSCHFTSCFKPSEFVSQLFPAALAASYWNLFCSTIPSAFRSKWKGFKLHSEIQSKKSNNFTPKESLRAHKLLIPPQFTQSPFLWQPWESELSQDDPISMPDVFSLKKPKGTWLFYLWWRPGIQEKLTPSLCQPSSTLCILRNVVPVGQELKNQAQSGRDLEIKIYSFWVFLVVAVLDFNAVLKPLIV